MDWQLWGVVLIVLAAAVYLVRQTWRAWSGAKSGCGSCSCAKVPASDGQTTMIPLEQVKLRPREPRSP
jgi:hypothetical protein